MWPEPVSDPSGKEGVPGGLLLSQQRLILQEVYVPDCRVSPWLFIPAGSTASFFPGTAHKLFLITPDDQVSAMDLTPAICRAFPEKTQGRQRGFLFSVEKYRYSLLTSTSAISGD